MQNTHFSTGIQELTLDEIENVDGGMSNVAKGMIYIGIGLAAVALAPELGAGAVAAVGIRLAGSVLVTGGGLVATH